MIPALVFDIETAGEVWEGLDDTTQEALTKWIYKGGREESAQEALLEGVREGLGFSPFTGEVVALGVLDSEKDQGAVYYQDAPREDVEGEEDSGIVFRIKSEKEMLEQFWTLAEHYDVFVSFNGRAFDVPFLLIRSLVHGITPTKDLMANRYLSSQPRSARHIDLADQLTFYSATRQRPSLHIACRAFGIESPKDDMAGEDVAQAFRDGKGREIAEYNMRDIVATRALYRKTIPLFERFV